MSICGRGCGTAVCVVGFGVLFPKSWFLRVSDVAKLSIERRRISEAISVLPELTLCAKTGISMAAEHKHCNKNLLRVLPVLDIWVFVL
jgi:hypothetical protein